MSVYINIPIGYSGNSGDQNPLFSDPNIFQGGFKIYANTTDLYNVHPNFLQVGKTLIYLLDSGGGSPGFLEYTTVPNPIPGSAPYTNASNFTAVNLGTGISNIQSAGTSQTFRTTLNFSSAFSISDNAGNGSTDIDVSFSESNITDLGTTVTLNTDTDVSTNAWVLDEDAMLSNSATKVPTQQSVRAYVQSQLSATLNYRGGYDANTNTPDLDTSPSGILLGDMYVVTAAGNFFATAVNVGDILIADQNDPVNVTQWTLVQDGTNQAAIIALMNNLVITGVTPAGTDRILINDASDSFNLKYITVDDLSITATIADSAENRLLSVGSGGGLQAEQNFTFDGTTAIISGVLRPEANGTRNLGASAQRFATSYSQVVDTQQVNVDNLRLDGNTISSTDTNGNVSIVPDGTGFSTISRAIVNGLTFPLTDGSSGQILETNGVGELSWADKTDATLDEVLANGSVLSTARSINTVGNNFTILGMSTGNFFRVSNIDASQIFEIVGDNGNNGTINIGGVPALATIATGTFNASTSLTFGTPLINLSNAAYNSAAGTTSLLQADENGDLSLLSNFEFNGSDNNFIAGGATFNSTNAGSVGNFFYGIGTTITDSEVSRYNTVIGNNHTIVSNTGSIQWGYITGEQHTITNNGTQTMNNMAFVGGYNNSLTNTGPDQIFTATVIGGANNTITGTDFISPTVVGARNSTITNTLTFTAGDLATTSGIAAINFGYQTDASSPGAGNGSQASIASGHRAIQMSANTASQTAGHGVLADFAAIFSGVDHNLPVGADYSIILGGQAIKGDASTTHTAYLPKLRLGQGTSATIPTFAGTENGLFIDSVTGEVKQGGVFNTVNGGTIAGGNTVNFSGGDDTQFNVTLDPDDTDSDQGGSISLQVGDNDNSVSFQMSMGNEEFNLYAWGNGDRTGSGNGLQLLSAGPKVIGNLIFTNAAGQDNSLALPDDPALASSGSIRYNNSSNETLEVHDGTSWVAAGSKLGASSPPASAGATGSAGDIAWDADYVYVCVASNTWKRASIATW